MAITPKAAGADSSAAGTYVRGRVISNGLVIEDGLVAVEGSHLAFADQASRFDDRDWTRGRSFPPGTLLIPGLVDVHCHGAFGCDFSTAGVEEAEQGIRRLHAAGTTTLLASTVADAPDRMKRAASVLAQLAEDDAIAGIHLEGPFLSPAWSGAQDPAHVLHPDPVLAQALLDAAGGHTVTMTLAPELPGTEELVSLLLANSVTPSFGHTAADSDTAAEILATVLDLMASTGFEGYADRPTVTHLYNAMPPPHHRSPGPVPGYLAAAAKGHLVVELIADGRHLAPGIIASTFDLVGGTAVALVSDGTAAVGQPDGTYPLGPVSLQRRDGTTTVAGRADDPPVLAGGNGTLLDVLKATVAAGVDLVSAVASATRVPAQIIGLADEVGDLRPGLRADMLALGPRMELLGVMRKGRWLNTAAS